MKQYFRNVSFTSSRSLWRNRDLLVVVGLLGVSALGTAMADIALLLHQQSANSAHWAVAPLLAAATLPLVLMVPVAGWLADRYDSRRTLLVAGLWQAACCAVLALSPAQPVLLALVALLAVGTSVTAATVGALVPALVGPDQLGAASSLRQTTAYGAALLGPALGGVMYGLAGLRVPLLADAATYAVTAVAVLAVRTRRPAVVVGEPTGTWDGLRLIRRDRALTALLVLIVSLVVVGEVSNVVEVFLVRETLHASAATFGLLLGVWTAGMVGGGVVVGRLRSQASWSWALLVGGVLLGGAVVVMGVAPSAGWLVAPNLVGGVGNGLLNVCTTALSMARSPEPVRGRVGAAINGAARAAGLGSLLLGGVLAALLAPRTIFVLVGLAALLVIVACAAPLVRATRTPISGTTDNPSTVRSGLAADRVS